MTLRPRTAVYLHGDTFQHQTETQLDPILILIVSEYVSIALIKMYIFKLTYSRVPQMLRSEMFHFRNISEQSSQMLHDFGRFLFVTFRNMGSCLAVWQVLEISFVVSLWCLRDH